MKVKNLLYLTGWRTFSYWGGLARLLSWHQENGFWWDRK